MPPQFDIEIDRVLGALEHATRRELMGFYITKASLPSVIAQEVRGDVGHLSYHTQVLLNVGGVEVSSSDASDESGGKRYVATELGLLAFLRLDRDQSG
jgi:hypothetical protein